MCPASSIFALVVVAFFSIAVHHEVVSVCVCAFVQLLCAYAVCVLCVCVQHL